jgi:hypothetical protein
MFGGDKGPLQWRGGSLVNRDVGSSCQLQGLQGVLGGELDRDVARDGGDGQDFKLRGRAERGEKRYGVIG